MRGIVEIVWLEDVLNSREHLHRVKSVENIIESKGYESEIEQVNNLAEAKEILTNPGRRVDFFISDYNLDGGETGLEYLIEIRKKEFYNQFFILYSKNDYNEIKQGVIDKLEENKIELFSNFNFISLSNSTPEIIRLDFAKAVDISLSRWDELNAIRGLYMCEHAELESKLRERYPMYTEKDKTYKDLFLKLKNSMTDTYRRLYGADFDEWSRLIDYRNLLAHTSEGFDSEKGFYIKSNIDDDLIIYERNLDEDRTRLKNLKEKILFLIESPNRPYHPNKIPVGHAK